MPRWLARSQLKEAVAQCRERLYRLAWSWCHDRALAEDLVHDTLSKAFASLGELRELDRLDVWLTRILVNRYRDHLRRPAPETGWQDDRISEEDHPERALERQGIVELTRRAMAQLHPDQRQVITLVDLAEFSYAEAASILGVPTGTVMSRLFRGRKALKVLLEPDLTSAETRVVPLRTRT